MRERFEILGGADPDTAAAIVAALMRLTEEQITAAAVPPAPPAQTQWVLSTRPRPVQPVVSARPAPSTLGWSVSSDDGDRD
jgi:hypothetical protein